MDLFRAVPAIIWDKSKEPNGAGLGQELFPRSEVRETVPFRGMVFPTKNHPGSQGEKFKSPFDFSKMT